MIKELYIQHLILIDELRISFGRGLNVLSGETGAGKSALISALALLTGARSDVKVVRHGTSKAVVEGVFDISSLHRIRSILEEGGVEHEDDLIIRRELSDKGKSRAWINQQPVQLKFLRTIGEKLALFVGQHGSQALREASFPRVLVDQFGALEELLESFQRSWENCKSIKRQISEISENEAKRLRELDRCNLEIDEIASALPKEGEDEELFQEYSKLTSFEERREVLQNTLSLLEEGAIPALYKANEAQLSEEELEQKIQMESSLKELQEVAFSFSRKLGEMTFDPYRVEAINQRLALLEGLKKKYGTTLSDVLIYQKEQEKRKFDLEGAEFDREALQENLKVEEEKCDQFAKELSLKRKKVAIKLEKGIEKHLKDLNLANVMIEMQFTSCERSEVGDESIELLFTPNAGEKAIPIQSSASGGELSRFLLVVYLLLAKKEETPLLIFDEVDANIGGKTAVQVGEKLKELGASHQVFCITHFPQVAQFAKVHMQIYKQEVGGRTQTGIICLDQKQRENELIRMVGGREFVS